MSSTHTNDSLNSSNYVDKLKDTHFVFENDKLPSEIPDVEEVGATTAPLLSAAYFIGAKCQDYNDDFMLCQKEAKGNGPIDCLKEGRRVTRCASGVLKDLNTHCSDEFRLHWQCLSFSNLEYKNCRKAESLLNKCVFEKMNLVKKIPGIPEDRQIHLKQNPVLKPVALHQDSEVAFKKAQNENSI
ncbi:Subunit of mitochondrial NADH:ubiquinone oxidoreductase (complex I) [Komagataella phaffii CBS 7435]|uniref:NADH-ubiquinone oxidoreductase n=3 Tax=Komagataella TaxID=460517 RepID=C4R7M4_KOMPG|nr:Hypothetical protein PAS_chr4_0355 [Komagataella phaffii GS115]AOA64566.1 GQ67_04696T0 [Komagataella phaffii]CAH2451023.1 Subunit of mitochondrial NADHubiquinone oxidoreductase (complex I) [Komagataella phaffii CBS 7435]CBI83549.1 NUPM (PGIV) subunit of mitochondrial NADH:ubiquinone oxidoreductase (complex I) [Komagataella pastoris]AOA70275.1 GQ68_04668T0 [Komagataella phaffii GS115]CAY71599.1 Hypothetical protein PAS_chr4_0355 [Komagataella phaffii GS115]